MLESLRVRVRPRRFSAILRARAAFPGFAHPRVTKIEFIAARMLPDAKKNGASAVRDSGPGVRITLRKASAGPEMYASCACIFMRLLATKPHHFCGMECRLDRKYQKWRYVTLLSLETLEICMA
jgi:hypothetical protein